MDMLGDKIEEALVRRDGRTRSKSPLAESDARPFFIRMTEAPPMPGQEEMDQIVPPDQPPDASALGDTEPSPDGEGSEDDEAPEEEARRALFNVLSELIDMGGIGRNEVEIRAYVGEHQEEIGDDQMAVLDDVIDMLVMDAAIIRDPESFDPPQSDASAEKKEWSGRVNPVNSDGSMARPSELHPAVGAQLSTGGGGGFLLAGAKSELSTKILEGADPMSLIVPDEPQGSRPSDDDSLIVDALELAIQSVQMGDYNVEVLEALGNALSHIDDEELLDEANDLMREMGQQGGLDNERALDVMSRVLELVTQKLDAGNEDVGMDQDLPEPMSDTDLALESTGSMWEVEYTENVEDPNAPMRKIQVQAKDAEEAKAIAWEDLAGKGSDLSLGHVRPVSEGLARDGAELVRKLAEEGGVTTASVAVRVSFAKKDEANAARGALLQYQGVQSVELTGDGSLVVFTNDDDPEKAQARVEAILRNSRLQEPEVPAVSASTSAPAPATAAPPAIESFHKRLDEAGEEPVWHRYSGPDTASDDQITQMGSGMSGASEDDEGSSDAHFMRLLRRVWENIRHEVRGSAGRRHMKTDQIKQSVMDNLWQASEGLGASRGEIEEFEELPEHEQQRLMSIAFPDDGVEERVSRQWDQGSRSAKPGKGTAKERVLVSIVAQNPGIGVEELSSKLEDEGMSIDDFDLTAVEELGMLVWTGNGYRVGSGGKGEKSGPVTAQDLKDMFPNGPSGVEEEEVPTFPEAPPAPESTDLPSDDEYLQAWWQNNSDENTDALIWSMDAPEDDQQMQELQASLEDAESRGIIQSWEVGPLPRGDVEPESQVPSPLPPPPSDVGPYPDAAVPTVTEERDLTPDEMAFLMEPEAGAPVQTDEMPDGEVPAADNKIFVTFPEDSQLDEREQFTEWLQQEVDGLLVSGWAPYDDTEMDVEDESLDDTGAQGYPNADQDVDEERILGEQVIGRMIPQQAAEAMVLREIQVRGGRMNMKALYLQLGNVLTSECIDSNLRVLAMDPQYLTVQGEDVSLTPAGEQHLSRMLEADYETRRAAAGRGSRFRGPAKSNTGRKQRNRAWKQKPDAPKSAAEFRGDDLDEGGTDPMMNAGFFNLPPEPYAQRVVKPKRKFPLQKKRPLADPKAGTVKRPSGPPSDPMMRGGLWPAVSEDAEYTPGEERVQRHQIKHYTKGAGKGAKFDWGAQVGPELTPELQQMVSDYKSALGSGDAELAKRIKGDLEFELQTAGIDPRTVLGESVHRTDQGLISAYAREHLGATNIKFRGEGENRVLVAQFGSRSNSERFAKWVNKQFGGGRVIPQKGGPWVTVFVKVPPETEADIEEDDVEEAYVPSKHVRLAGRVYEMSKRMAQAKRAGDVDRARNLSDHVETLLNQAEALGQRGAVEMARREGLEAGGMSPYSFKESGTKLIQTWQPQMTRSQADVWSRGSKIKLKLYHGTDNADEVRVKGFVEGVDEVNEHPGISFSQNRQYAQTYGAEVLEVQVNVANPLEVDNAFWSGTSTKEEHRAVYEELQESYSMTDAEFTNYLRNASVSELSESIQAVGYDAWYVRDSTGNISELRLFDKSKASILKEQMHKHLAGSYSFKEEDAVATVQHVTLTFRDEQGAIDAMTKIPDALRKGTLSVRVPTEPGESQYDAGERLRKKFRNVVVEKEHEWEDLG